MAWGGSRKGAGRPKNSDRARVASDAKVIGPVTSVPGSMGMSEGAMALLIDFLRENGKRKQIDRTNPLNNPYRIDPRKFGPGAMMLTKDKAEKRARGIMAMDDNTALASANQFAMTAWEAGGLIGDAVSEGLLFLGYPILSELAQRPEYRLFGEIRAEEMTRNWIELRGTEDESTKEDDDEEERERNRNDDDREAIKRKEGGEKPRDDSRNKEIEDKIKELTDFLEHLKVKAWFKDTAVHDSLFGIGHMYLDLKGANYEDIRDPENRMSIGNGRDHISKAKLGKGCLLGLRTIEPIWCYPTVYNAANPLVPSWYDPQVWYVMGAEIHKTRLLPFISRPVPDILKPAYAFGGLSMSQMAKPYVDIWLRTRESVGELIHAFSVMILQTNMATRTQPGGAGGGGGDIVARMMMMNALRDNQGMLVIDKSTEDFKNISAPISGLDELQAQAQEHLFSVGRIPAVKFAGIQPKGLNATSEGELRAFGETIHGAQEQLFRTPLTTVLDIAQVSLWGARDPDITYDFLPLQELTMKEKAEIRKIEAETDQIRIDSGVVSQEEARKKLAADPESGYDGIDPDDVPDLLGEEEGGLIPPDAGKGLEAELDQGDKGPGGGKKPPGGGQNGGGQPSKRPGGADSVVPFDGAEDAWNEADHPRGQPGNSGQFGSGGGGVAAKPAAAMPAIPSFLKAGKASNIGKPIAMGTMEKVGGQKGSNPGGVYKDDNGKEFYIKKGKTPAHVRNEMIAGALYHLAGTPTLQYRPVEGGEYIATEMAKLDKDNANKFDEKQRKEAAKDFAVHAWLGNWDAAGLGGDNLGIVAGKPTALDVGGALEFRAQGAPKGKAFGDKVTELDTLRDKNINRDTAKLFGDMTPSELRESANFVTAIPDKAIRKTVEKLGGAPELADKLIARKNDIAARADEFGSEGDPTKPTSSVVFGKDKPLPVDELNGVKFAAWDDAPKNDREWAGVAGQNEDIDEPAFELPEQPKNKEGKPIGMPKRAGSGVIIREADGRVWLMRPKNGYGGYQHTWPKGGLEKGLSPQANAIKEAYEETGLQTRITGFAGDHEGDTSFTRFYYAERVGGDPSKTTWESDGVVLAPQKKLDQFLNRSRDRKIANTLAQDEAYPKPNDRSIFAYMAPPEKAATWVRDQWAQCGACRMLVPEDALPAKGKHRKGCDLCVILGSQQAVDGGRNRGSCDEFAAWPTPDSTPDADVVKEHAKKLAEGAPGSATKQEVGYVERGVRCENCFYGGEPKCGWYLELNEKLPKLFHDPADIEPKACCNSQTKTPRAISQDAAPWEESKHPRKADGKFTAGAGEASSGEGKKGWVEQIADFISAPAKGGSHYRSAIAEALKYATPAEAMKLKLKLAASWKINALHMLKKGDHNSAIKIATKMKGLGDVEGANEIAAKAGIAPEPTPVAKKEDELKVENYIDFAAEFFEYYKADKMSEAKVLLEANPQHWPKLNDKYPNLMKKMGINVPAAPAKKSPEQKSPELSKAQMEAENEATLLKMFPAPTEAELTKAKKSVPLQMQYIPGDKPSGENAAAAQTILDNFNKQYADKQLTDPHDLAVKVANFKVSAQAINELAKQEKKKEQAAQSEAAKKYTTDLQKAQAAAAVKNKEYMKALGISETEAAAFNALVKMVGGSGNDLVEKFKYYENNAKDYNFPISGFEFALISGYINGTYGKVNKELRNKSLSSETKLYVSQMNKAISKLPKYTGHVERGTTLSKAQIAQYVPGQIITEQGFTSTGVGFKFSGNVSYKIKANGMRGGDFSKTANQSESEVIFMAHTPFMVHSVEEKGGITYITMEEI